MKQRLSLILLALLVFCGCFAPQFVRADSDTNLIANPSAETLQGTNPADWTADSWGTNDAVLSLTNDAHSGTEAMQVKVTSYSDGDAKWIPAAIAVTAGTSYTYTDYTKASTATQLVAAYTNAANAVSYAFLGTVQPSTDWQQNSLDITMPAGAQKVAILHLLQAPGTLTLDDASLTTKQQVVVPPPTSGNLIANPSMETANGSTPAGWQTDNWGTNSASFSYGSTGGHTGSASAKVQITQYTDGDAKWYFTPVQVQPNTHYTFSDYYMATAATSLVVRFDDGSGHYTYGQAGSVASATGWTQANATFTTPATIKYVTVFHLIANVGTLQTDDASLQTADVPVPPNGNLFANPSLETADPSNKKMPQSWQHGTWGTNAATFSYASTGHTDSRSIKAQITSYTNGAAYWHATPQPITGGQMYDFKDYYKSNIPSELDAEVTMADGSVQDIYLGAAFASPSSWTKFETQFTAPAGATSITIFHDIYSVGYVTTDDYSLSTFAYQGFNRPLVSITDDDGFADFYDNGLPILQKYGLPSTAYIISSYIGSSPYISLNQLKSLYAAGVEIGSHSVTHPDLSTLTAAKQNAELKNSQTTLQKDLGITITDYAAPYGAYNQQIVTDAAKYYQTYRGVEAGYNAKNNFDPMNLQVQNITNTTTVADIQGWLQEAAATNTWLILVYHQISPSPTGDDYNTYPGDFDAQMAAVKLSGITVKTVRQAMQEITPQL